MLTERHFSPRSNRGPVRCLLKTCRAITPAITQAVMLKARERAAGNAEITQERVHSFAHFIVEEFLVCQSARDAAQSVSDLKVSCSPLHAIALPACPQPPTGDPPSQIHSAALAALPKAASDSTRTVCDSLVSCVLCSRPTRACMQRWCTRCCLSHWTRRKINSGLWPSSCLRLLSVTLYWYRDVKGVVMLEYKRGAVGYQFRIMSALHRVA